MWIEREQKGAEVFSLFRLLLPLHCKYVMPCRNMWRIVQSAETCVLFCFLSSLEATEPQGKSKVFDMVRLCHRSAHSWVHYVCLVTEEMVFLFFFPYLCDTGCLLFFLFLQTAYMIFLPTLLFCTSSLSHTSSLFPCVCPPSKDESFGTDFHQKNHTRTRLA